MVLNWLKKKKKKIDYRVKIMDQFRLTRYAESKVEAL